MNSEQQLLRTWYSSYSDCKTGVHAPRA